jgi:hypothetical protein
MKASTKRTGRVQALGLAVLAVTASSMFAATLVAASTTAVEPSLAGVTTPTVSDLSSGNFTCTIQHLAVASERQQRIADAATVEEARDLALTPVRAARRALQVAGLVVPASEKTTRVRAELEGFEARVQKEETPAAVAGEFGRLLNVNMESGNLVQVADLNARGASVRGPGGCHYSTGEIVAIVFGFILFIIPGIILLIVLC